ncbi:AraC family transcriptional regulator [Kribbella sancticallisti]
MDRMAELRSLISRLAAGSSGPKWLDGVMAFATHQVTEPLGNITEPAFAFVAQGTKRSMLGNHVFDYHAGQYLVVSVDLPLTGNIIQASTAEPFLALGLPLQADVIAQLLLEARPYSGPRPYSGAGANAGVGLAVSDADDDLLDCLIRLLRLQERPDDLRILGPAVKREIHWRLMTGPQGHLVRQIGLADSRLSLVAHAIRWIRARYDQVIRIDDLADDLGLSVSSLNRNFRAVTAMSPVQYQKQLRLQEARIKLLAAPDDIASVGYGVGYDSPSQFSREYRRMFGAPPGEDAARLRNLVTIQE